MVLAACGGSDDDSEGSEQSASTSEITVSATATPSDSVPTEQPTALSTEPTNDATALPSATKPPEGSSGLLTFEEAQAAVDYELVMPDPLPKSLKFIGVTVPAAPAEPPPAPAGTANSSQTTPMVPGTMALLGFEPTSGTEQSITLTESPTSIEIGSPNDGEEITIDGTEVLKIKAEQSHSTSLVIYSWKSDDLYFILQSQIGPDLPLTADDLEALIAGTIP